MARCDSYFVGECTQGACEFASWVLDGWGNAGQWADSARSSGFGVTMTPTEGAVVVYGAGDGYSSFGHCGVVLSVGVGDQFLVHERNFVAWNEDDDRWSNSFDVIGFILPPGVQPGAGSPPPGRGAGGPPGDLIASWATLAGDWNQTLPEHINRLRRVRAALDQF